jgi:hypothetical protein
MIEDYFRSTFVALLKSSNRKESFFKAARPHPLDLIAVSQNQLSIEEAIANSLNFQNLDRICESFRTLEPKLSLAVSLRRPYRRRNRSLFDALSSVVEKRHEFVHRNVVAIDYRAENVQLDLEDIQAGIKRVYKAITDFYGWEFILTWAG